MNYIKLSALLLMTSGSLVYAKAQNFFTQGKKYGSIAISAMEKATQKKVAPKTAPSLEQQLADRINEKMNSIFGVMSDLRNQLIVIVSNMENTVETIIKKAKTPKRAKIAWDNFQDFFDGFKQAFEKNIPMAPAFFSESEKKGYELCVEAIKLPYDFGLATKDFTEYTKEEFVEYSKSWQAKIEESMSKLLKTMHL